MSETLSDTRPRARKAHRCSVCDGTIAAGDTYRRAVVVDGGDLWTWRAHQLCNAAFELARDPFCHGYDGGPDWDEEIRPLVLSFFTGIASASPSVTAAVLLASAACRTELLAPVPAPPSVGDAP